MRMGCLAVMLLSFLCLSNENITLSNYFDKIFIICLLQVKTKPNISSPLFTLDSPTSVRMVNVPVNRVSQPNSYEMSSCANRHKDWPVPIATPHGYDFIPISKRNQDNLSSTAPSPQSLPSQPPLPSLLLASPTSVRMANVPTG
jgi:hypothetical protein